MMQKYGEQEQGHQRQMELLNNLQRIKMSHERNQVKVTVPTIVQAAMRRNSTTQGRRNRSENSYPPSDPEAFVPPTNSLLPPKLRSLKQERTKLAQERNYIRERQNLIKQYNVANPSLKFRENAGMDKKLLKRDLAERRPVDDKIGETGHLYQRKKIFNPKRMKSVIKNMSQSSFLSEGASIRRAQLHPRNRTSSTGTIASTLREPYSFLRAPTG